MLLWAALALAAAGQRAVEGLSKDLPGAPVRVLAAPRILRRGEVIPRDRVLRELRAVGYRQVAGTPRQPGEYATAEGWLALYRRAWAGAHTRHPAVFARLRWLGERLVEIRDGTGRNRSVLICEPVELGAFRGPLSQARTQVALDAFPPRLVDAVLAAEDARFLDHAGVDPRGIIRAAWVDLVRRRGAQGGSTITQQVIKNRVVGSAHSLTRKMKEALLALWVERSVSKERLLEIYLNEVYLGQRGPVSVLGMPAAARFYFGKQVGDLDLDEMALLAGLIASPGRYDPRRHPERALLRRNWVLGRMASLDLIDRAEQAAASERPLTLAPPAEALDPAGDLLDAVAVEVARRGWEPVPSRQPAVIETTVEVDVQAAARGALAATLADLERARPSLAPLEGAVVVLRPATGAIVALVGGRRGQRGGFHRALSARRPPGSAFKPFVALAAFASGEFSAFSTLEDSPLSVGRGKSAWRPENHDHRFRGTVTLRTALEQSLNVPLARLGLAVGPEAIIAAARAAGIEGRLPATASLALGAGEVTPLDLATGYATLLRLGDRLASHLVLAAGREGRAAALEGVEQAPGVLAPEACYQVLDALRGVARVGTGRALASALGSREVAAKTGTSPGGRDAWFVVAGRAAVVLVWVGRDDGTPAGLYGAKAALPVARRMLEQLGPSLVGTLPDPPPGIVRVPVDPRRRCSLSGEGPLETFVSGRQPPPCRKKSWWRRLVGS